jgi:PKD domain-containing protein
MGRRVIAGGVLIVVVVAAGAARGGSLGGRWLSPPFTLDMQGGAATVAVAQSGVAVVAWESGFSGGTFFTRVSTRGADHRWSPASSFGWNLLSVGLAVDAAGDALVTGTKPEGSGWSVVAFERAADSFQWSGPISISGPEYDTGFPELAANESGQAIVAWRGVDRYGDLPVTRAAFRRADGTWEPPQNLGYGSDVDPAVAIDARGGAVVVWRRDIGGRATVYAEFRPAGGEWEPAAVLSQQGVFDPSVVMNHRGDALAYWVENDAAGNFLSMSSVRRAGSSSWTPSSRIALSDSVAVGALSVALDDRGNATVVGQRGSGEIEAVTRPADTVDWSAPVVLGDVQDGYYAFCSGPGIALDGAGDALVVWGGAQLHSARRQAGSATWEKAVVANVPACGVSLAVDRSGDAVAIWKASDGHFAQLDVEVLDTTSPVITRIVIPRVAHRGRKVRFSVRVSDLWAPLARSPSWSFGDGSTGHGRALQHTYRRAGRYRVSVSAIDQAANTATSTATIRVTAQR